MKLPVALISLLALVSAALPATAGQIEPAQAVAPNLYTGRWYEIARTPNHLEGDCQASTTDFSGWTGSAFSATQSCHAGAPSGPSRQVTLQGRVLPQSNNAKMQLAMLGGLISKQYWILDHSVDNAWLIMTTPDDHYVWLMSRRPVLSVGARAAAFTRMQQLGLDLSRLVFPTPATH
jgi:apolipoprotein D and lipocalin family protein